MTTININSKNYDIIQGTQSDGRCFFASVFYILNEEKAKTDEILNNCY